MWMLTTLLFGVFTVGTIDGDKFKGIVVSYAGEVTMANVTDTGKVSLQVVPDDGSCTPIQRIRRYCAHTCEESYNQLLVNEKYLFVFSNRSALIVSNIDQELETVKKQCITLSSCDPLVSTYEQIETPYVHVHCSPESWNEYAVMVRTLSPTANGGWKSLIHTFEPHYKPNGVSAIFFSSLEDILYLAYTTDMGMGFCGITEKSDQPDPILPDNCPWIAKISGFNKFSLLVECTSGAASNLVIVAWVYSWLKAEFVQKLPVNNYPLGHLVFSDDSLFCATYQEKDIRVMNLTYRDNPHIYPIEATDIISSAHFIIQGLSPQLVISHSRGVDVIEFEKGPKSRTLEGSQQISLPVGSTPPPPLTLINNQYVAFTTKNEKLTILSLNGDDAPIDITMFSPPARCKLFIPPVPNSPEPSTVDTLLNGLVVGLTSTGSIVAVCALVVILTVLTVYIGKKKMNRSNRGGHRPLIDNPSDSNNTALNVNPIWEHRKRRKSLIRHGSRVQYTRLDDKSTKLSFETDIDSWVYSEESDPDDSDHGNQLPVDVSGSGCATANTLTSETIEVIIEQFPVETTTEDAPLKTTTKQSSTGTTAEQSSTGTTAEQSSTGTTAEQSSTGTTAEQSSTGTTAEQSSTGTTAEQSSTGTTAEQSSTGTTAKQSPTETSPVQSPMLTTQIPCPVEATDRDCGECVPPTIPSVPLLPGKEKRGEGDGSN